MTGVVMVVCVAFGLTVSEAKTGSCPYARRDVGVHRHIQRRGSETGVQQN